MEVRQAPHRSGGPRQGRRARRRSDASLERLLRRGISPSEAARGLSATVALDLSDGAGWTIRLDDGDVSLSPGLRPRPDTTVVTDVTTLAEVMQGTRSGVEAFLQGRLRVRGNLALSLRLDGLFEGPGRPVHFPRPRTLRAGGVHTFYLEAGEGPPVILLHGLGATNASLLPTMWDLAKDHRVIVPDLPGFGDSDKPVRAYDAPFFARWLQSFMDGLEIDRADLLGNSMGGRVALEAALEAPERVSRLVLLTPSPAFIRRRQFVRIVRLLRPEMALLPVPIPHRRVVRSIKSMFARPERVPDSWYMAAADEFIRIFRTLRGRIAFLSAAREIYLEEPYGEKGFWDRLPALRPPALFVWGERDRLVPAKFAPHVERCLPAASSVVIRDCGHVPQYEHPKETTRLVRRFLAGR